MIAHLHGQTRFSDGEIVAEGNYTELTANGAFKQILEECESEKRELARKLAAEEGNS